MSSAKEYVSDTEYLADKVLAPLRGGVIENAVYDRNNDFAGFVVQLPTGDKKICWLLQDPEGNGPGYLDIADLKKAKVTKARRAAPNSKLGQILRNHGRRIRRERAGK